MYITLSRSIFVIENDWRFEMQEDVSSWHYNCIRTIYSQPTFRLHGVPCRSPESYYTLTTDYTETPQKTKWMLHDIRWQIWQCSAADSDICLQCKLHWRPSTACSKNCLCTTVVHRIIISNRLCNCSVVPSNKTLADLIPVCLPHILTMLFVLKTVRAQQLKKRKSRVG